VQEMGWSAKKNGVLLALADGKFDGLLTIDQNLEYQQDLANRQIALLVVSAISNQIEDLEPVVPHVLTALRNIRPRKRGPSRNIDPSHLGLSLLTTRAPIGLVFPFIA